jgi:hypothetical protein
MKRLGLVLLGMVMIFVYPGLVAGIESQPKREGLAAPLEQQKAQAIWTGKSGGFTICWTPSDIQARPLKKPGRLAFSAAQLSRLGFQTFISPPNLDGNEEHITYERKFTLLSVVGSIVSLKDELYYEITPSAHPGWEIRFTAIDLAKPGKVPDTWANEEGLNLKKLGKVAKLTDYFPEQGVLKALLNHASIQEALPEESPQSLAKLFDFLKGQRIEIQGDPYTFPQDFLTRFAFHHLEGDRVAVRLGLLSGEGAARGWHAELGLLLPIPPALKKSLSLAASGQEGFLMENRKKLAGEAVTLITFSFIGKGKVK